MLNYKSLLVISLFVLTVFAHADDRIELGQLQTGAMVSFVRAEGEWGLDISGDAPHLLQTKPIQIVTFGGKQSRLLAGYQSVTTIKQTIVAKGTVISSDGVVFTIEDCWRIAGDILSLDRKVSVTGSEDNTGFYSAMRLVTNAEVEWDDAQYLIPGLYYGASHTRDSAPGGRLYYNAKYFSIREDYLSAPLFGIMFRDGNWVAVLDPKPNGSTTWEETTSPANTPIIDERIQFGALGAHKVAKGGLEFGFWLPGTTNEFMVNWADANAKPTQVIRHRGHPVKNGLTQNYQVAFRFGKSGSFRDMEREAWRWAWEQLDPQVPPIDVEVTRRTLIDHLADRVLTVDDRVGIPFVIDAVTGLPGSYYSAALSRMYRLRQEPDKESQELAGWARTVGIDMDPKAAELFLWHQIVIGFCGKHVEVAEQLLLEGDRDSGPRGKRMRELGLNILHSLIHYVPMEPYPAGEAFDIRNGRAGSARVLDEFTLRSLAEDMRIMMDLIHREHALGREHSTWLNWAKSFADWLLTQQRADGSFPMKWIKDNVTDTAGVCTYSAVPFLVKMSENSGDKKYFDAAVRAADYMWENFGSKGVYLGATGTPTVADKESGMLSTEAFLALYENTGENKWLEYAKSAADYTESWIWIWNVPMPIGADKTILGWKPGVPTIGVNGIGSDGAGGVDQYLDWAVPTYARLFKYTNDKHYFDVAYILLHGTKAMLALPGRSYDLLGPGWQQEHWRMGPNVRGLGAHRTWLPWVSVNHLHGITGLEEFDLDLYHDLISGN